jgi:hypothetical protein
MLQAMDVSITAGLPFLLREPDFVWVDACPALEYALLLIKDRSFQSLVYRSVGAQGSSRESIRNNLFSIEILRHYCHFHCGCKSNDGQKCWCFGVR